MLCGIGVQNPRPREIPFGPRGMYFPIHPSSRQCTGTIYVRRTHFDICFGDKWQYMFWGFMTAWNEDILPNMILLSLFHDDMTRYDFIVGQKMKRSYQGRFVRPSTRLPWLQRRCAKIAGCPSPPSACFRYYHMHYLAHNLPPKKCEILVWWQN